MTRGATSPPPSGRAERRAAWSGPVTGVRYVDGPRGERLARVGVFTVGDLVRHYPARYLDLTRIAPLRSLAPGAEATAVGTVHEVTVKHPKPRLSITEVAIVDDSGVLIGTWFNQAFIASRFKEGDRVAFAGKVQMEFGIRRIRNPFVERLGSSAEVAELGRILPVHPATEGLSTNWIRRLVSEALAEFGDVPDPLPGALRADRDLMDLSAAIRAVHFPKDHAELDAARRRLAYEELLTVRLGMSLRRHAVVDLPGHAHTVDGPRQSALRAALPFELTPDQENAVREVLADMAAPRPMNRMLLGDVGTGKTAVAALVMAAAADSGTQAAMMAPTEVLAQQYSRSVGPLLDEAGITWALLTGSTAAAERKRVVAGLADGTVTVGFGTHALLTGSVGFHDLTLVIVDEQHRFGVQQRLALRSKGEASDMLVMTATPIPRSLALTLYGDLDASTLRQRPGGRTAEHVRTRIVPRASRPEAYGEVRRAVAAGNQAYVICALVDESDATEAKAAVKEARRLEREVFADLKVGLLTGPMKAAEKEAVMASFRDGATDVLVATTVVEVGVDVPNATVMIVEDADRFGLAQLHQLRGRIGRGEHPGLFLLFADPKTDEGRRRMKAVASTSDGFALAEEDLRLRGEGQVLGARQHGLPELRIASVLRDTDLLELARADAERIVAEDPRLAAPEHGPLALELRERLGSDWEWVSSG